MGGEVFVGDDPGPFAKAWEILLYDLNSQGALGQIFGRLKKLKPLGLSDEEKRQALGGLGFVLDALGLQLPELVEEEKAEAPDQVQQLAQARWEAKQARDWDEADRLRGEIAACGWTILDSKDGFTLEKS